MPETIKLSELIATRLSHDLSGQIGAVSNALQLYDDAPDMLEQIMELIRFSSDDLMIKIKFFRLAYGVPSKTENADLEQVREIVGDYLKTKKVVLDWDFKYDVCNYLSKMILLCASIVGEALIKGGTVKIYNGHNVSSEGLDVHKIIVEGTGEMIKFDSIDTILGNVEISEVTSRNLPCYIVFLLAHQIGQKIDIKVTDKNFRATIG